MNGKVKEFLDFGNQYNLDYTEVQIQKILQIESKMNYNGADIDYFIELGDFIYHNPVFKVLKEYKELFNIAYHNDLLSPVLDATSSDIANSSHASERVPVIEGVEAVKTLNLYHR